MRKMFLVLLLLACWPHAASAEQASAGERRDGFSWLPDLGESGALTEENRRLRSGLLMGGAVTGVLWYGSAHWWQNSMNSNFSTVREGWFGQGTYTGGADKLGHMYSTYVGTRLLTSAFEWAGHDRHTAAWLAAATAWGSMLVVEIGDGFSRDFRFSREDLVMNTLGSGLSFLLERNPALDQLVDFRFMYWPSSDAKNLGQTDPVSDHSGQTYLLAFKGSGVPALRDGPLRYFELAVGYGTRGYEPDTGGERSRNMYYGISLNVAEILGTTLFKNRHGSRTQRISNGVLEVLQIPGTAALAEQRL